MRNRTAILLFIECGATCLFSILCTIFFFHDMGDTSEFNLFFGKGVFVLDTILVCLMTFFIALQFSFGWVKGIRVVKIVTLCLLMPVLFFFVCAYTWERFHLMKIATGVLFVLLVTCSALEKGEVVIEKRILTSIASVVLSAVVVLSSVPQYLFWKENYDPSSFRLHESYLCGWGDFESVVKGSESNKYFIEDETSYFVNGVEKGKVTAIDVYQALERTQKSIGKYAPLPDPKTKCVSFTLRYGRQKDNEGEKNYTDYFEFEIYPDRAYFILRCFNVGGHRIRRDFRSFNPTTIVGLFE